MTELTISDQDHRLLAQAWKNTGGRAWQPKDIDHPIFKRWIDLGLVEVRNMTWRCGFEAWDAPGVVWTEAGRRVALGDVTDLEGQVVRSFCRALCAGSMEGMLQDGFRPLVPLQDTVALIVRRLEAGGISRTTILGALTTEDPGNGQ
jgi:hypothetical protein